MTSNYEAKINALREDALNIRRNVWRALRGAGSGHMGGSCSAADLLAALYFDHLRLRPQEPNWPGRDRFVLSKGHANAALGAALARAGFIDDSVLDQFYAYQSPFGMHPDIKMPGVEMSTGGLGHGLSVAIGMALGARMQGKDFRTVVMLGDGELQEGSNWEGAMAAAQFKLSNLTAILDYNKIQQSGPVAEMQDLEPLAEKFTAFGWAVREIDGHDMAAIVEALDALPHAADKPSMIIAHTVKGKGVSFAEDSFLWHNNLVTDEVYEKAMAELGDGA
ncbi:MAG: transketolase [Rhodospirillaceae bacterium]|jgi:transketolase|nr:transketolase [Rhodospirillaceae bacterium]MBT5050383.1 transketolase [Rhodospirillaceae bacterium]MBT5898222.1 transketolase [Rhodospirillaceae bacterium]MBT6431395.1 transketolase [Rhodospirillaceae bacterium]MBT7758482.1 transketolase [Rhodospirillaceae bacterium]